MTTHTRVNAILWLAGMAGTVAALPYFLLTPAGTLPAAAALKLLAAAAITLGIAAPLGGWAAARVGLQAPWFTGSGRDGLPAQQGLQSPAMRRALLVVALGALLGLAAQWLDTTLPHAPGWHAVASPPRPAWAELASSLFGGVTEEVLVFWCGLSVAAWLLRALLARRAGAGAAADALPSAVFWWANAAAAIALGVLHLPGAMAATPLGLGLAARVLLVEGAPGLVYGALFRRHGIEAAMLAHLASDLLRHALVAARV